VHDWVHAVDFSGQSNTRLFLAKQSNALRYETCQYASPHIILRVRVLLSRCGGRPVRLRGAPARITSEFFFGFARCANAARLFEFRSWYLALRRYRSTVDTCADPAVVASGN
jgi:hypothetical protein